MPKGTVTRITVGFHEQDNARLEELEEKTEAYSKSEVIRISIRVHKALLDLLNEKGELPYIDKDGTTTKLKILF